MGEVIAITSGKGGVGKTTMTAGLGAALASMGKKVLAVDLDIGTGDLTTKNAMSRPSAVRVEGAMYSSSRSFSIFTANGLPAVRTVCSPRRLPCAS